MLFQKSNFARLFPATLSVHGCITETCFGFESGGKRFFNITIPGQPRIEQGMTVVALLEKPDGWEGKGLLGWIDCSNGTIACGSAPRLFGIFLFNLFFAIMLSLLAYYIFNNPTFAQLIAACFGGFTLRFLYLTIKALLIKRALLAVRNECHIRQSAG